MSTSAAPPGRQRARAEAATGPTRGKRGAIRRGAGPPRGQTERDSARQAALRKGALLFLRRPTQPGSGVAEKKDRGPSRVEARRTRTPKARHAPLLFSARP